MKINKENYFSTEAHNEYMSVTQYKSFRQCEASTMAELSGEWEREVSDAMLQGSYVHAFNEGKLEEFIENHPEMFMIKTSNREAKLKSKFELCNKIIEVMQQDKLFMASLSGKKEVVFTAELFGTPWKILIDSYFPEAKRFGDLKVLKALDGKSWNKELQMYENIFESYGYFTQMAVYAEIERLANKRDII